MNSPQAVAETHPPIGPTGAPVVTHDTNELRHLIRAHASFSFQLRRNKRKLTVGYDS